jgi:hypothetical protein
MKAVRPAILVLNILKLLWVFGSRSGFFYCLTLSLCEGFITLHSPFVPISPGNAYLEVFIGGKGANPLTPTPGPPVLSSSSPGFFHQPAGRAKTGKGARETVEAYK